MSLIVNNVVNASSQISYSYLGSEEIFGYLITLNYSIKIEDINFDNDDGVLLSGRAAIRQAYKRQNITARIAGDEIHNGLITSLSFSEGALVGEEIANVTIEERRRLSSYSSKVFSKYIPSPHLIESFDENYTLSRSSSTYSYSRNISIQYAQDAGSQFLTNAKVFLTNYYYENRPQIGYYEDGISENARFNSGYNGILSESIDLVNLKVDLQETFESSFIESSEGVSKKIKNSFSVDDTGYLSKTISIDLTSLKYDSQRVLEKALGDTVDSIITQEYASFGNPFSIEKGISKDSNSATLSIKFSTNPRLSQDNSVTYSCKKSKAGAFLNYELSASYKSKGKNILQRYDNLIAFWSSAKDKNEEKVTSLFPESSNLIFEKSRNASISRTSGTVNETIIFSTDDSYDTGGLPTGIIKYKINVDKQKKNKRNSVVLDLMNLKEKIVRSDLDSLGSATVTTTAIAHPSYGLLKSKDFLNSKTSDMNNSLEEAVYYATSDVVTTDFVNGTTTRVINYIIA
jgi:hypothetical protein